MIYILIVLNVILCLHFVFDSEHHVIIFQQTVGSSKWEFDSNIREWIATVYSLLAADLDLCCNCMDSLSYLLQF